MKTTKILWISGMAVLLFACSTSKRINESNAALDEMVASKKFEFRARFAQPMVTNALSQIAVSGLLPPGNNIGQIDVRNSANLFRMKGDSIEASLAYYGERRLGGGYRNDPGIVFNSVPEDLEIEKNEKTQGYILKFDASHRTEVLQVILNVYPDLSAAVDINSSHRTRIRYLGNVKAFDEQ